MFRELLSSFRLNAYRNRENKRHFRPMLLALEDRITPATTLLWTGPANGNWSLATNWTVIAPLGGVASAPGGGDTAVFDKTNGANTNSTMDLGGAGSAHIGKLVFQNGYSGTVTLNANLWVDILDMESNATITSTNKKLVINQSTSQFFSATLFGTSTWTQGTINVGGGVAGGGIDLHSEATHPLTFNMGALGTTVTLNSYLAIGSSGDSNVTVNWKAGNVTVPAGNVVDNYGTFTVDSSGTMGTGGGAAKWDFYNRGTFNAGKGSFNHERLKEFPGSIYRKIVSALGGPDVFELSGAVALDDASETLEVDSGTLQIDGDVTVSAGTVDLEGGELDVGGAVAASGGSVLVNNATLSVTGNYSGGLSANGATLSVGNDYQGDGDTSLTSSSLTVGGNFALNSGSLEIEGGTANITGTVTQTSSNVDISGQLIVSGDYVQSGGTFLESTNNVFLSIGGAYTASGGAFLDVTSPVGSFYASGDVTIGSGCVLVFVNGGIESAGNVYIASGGTLVGGGVVQLDTPGTALHNDGTITLQDEGIPTTLLVNGNYVQTGTLNLELSYFSPSSSKLTVTGSASLGGVLNVNLNDGTPSAGDNFDLIHYGSRSGTFATINPPSLSTVTWDFRYDDPTYPTDLSLWVV
jgi:hypothetical protein